VAVYLLTLALVCMLLHLDNLVVVLLIPETTLKTPESSEKAVGFDKCCSDGADFHPY